MPISLAQAQYTIFRSGFTVESISAKLIEFRSRKTGRFLYMYTDQGFPDHAYIVIHPDTETSNILSVSGIQAKIGQDWRHGSNMRAFPKRMNDGAEEEHYGRPLQALSLAALEGLCREYDH